MKIFTIENETNNIVVHPTTQEAEAVANAERFRNESGLSKLAADWPAGDSCSVAGSVAQELVARTRASHWPTARSRRGAAATSATSSSGSSRPWARRSGSGWTRRGPSYSAARQALLRGFDGQVHVRYRNRYGRERSYYTTFEGVIPWVERRHAEAEWDGDTAMLL